MATPGRDRLPVSLPVGGSLRAVPDATSRLGDTMSDASDGQARSSRDRGPRPVGDLLARLLARTGYDREQAPRQLDAAWPQAVPQTLLGLVVPGRVRKGVLEVLVSHSAAAQELGFHKAEIIGRLAAALPDEPITDIRCRLSADVAPRTTGTGDGPSRNAV